MQDASASKPFPIPCKAYHFWSHQVTLGAVRRHSGNSLSKGQLLTMVVCLSLCFVKVGCCLMTQGKSGFLHSTLHVLRSKARLARGGVQSLVGCGCLPWALTIAGFSQCYFLHQDGQSTGRLSRFVFNDSESMPMPPWTDGAFLNGWVHTWATEITTILLKAICLCLTCAWPLMIATIKFCSERVCYPRLSHWWDIDEVGPRFIGKAPFLEVTLTVGGRFGTTTKTTRGQGPPICPRVMGAIQYFFLCGPPGGGCPCSSDCSRLGARSIWKSCFSFWDWFVNLGFSMVLSVHIVFRCF